MKMNKKNLTESEINSIKEQDEKEDRLWDEDDDDFPALYHSCPACGRSYDEIDFDFQRCHHCKYSPIK